MPDERGRVISAASDGACSGNPGPGGWGALLRFEDGSVEEFGGHNPNTTNNRMELEAALAIFKKLKDLKRHPKLTIRTDSKYLINGLNTWLEGWKKKNWKNSSGKTVLNKDLWEELDAANLKDVGLEFVRGHSGDPDNERVDRIAVSFSKGTHIYLQCKSNYKANQNYEVLDIEEKKNINLIEKENLENLKKLINRLDIANYLANKGYSLNIKELKKIVDIPSNELEEIKGKRKWRDWNISRLSIDQWKLEHIIQKDCSTRETKDEK